MAENEYREATLLVEEIEDDAFAGEPLTMDQRIALAGIHASLASTALYAEQIQAIREQTEILRANGDVAASMLALMTPPTTDKPDAPSEPSEVTSDDD